MLFRPRSIVTETLSYLAKTCALLTQRWHFEGRSRQSTADPMIVLTQSSYLLHMENQRDLLGSLRSRSGGLQQGTPQATSPPPASVCQTGPRNHSSLDRKRPAEPASKLKFNGITSADIPTNADIPHWSPLSPVLHLFYNCDLLGIPRETGESNSHSTGFICDIAYGVGDRPRNPTWRGWRNAKKRMKRKYGL
jgi:hypothetical protein